MNIFIKSAMLIAIPLLMISGNITVSANDNITIDNAYIYATPKTSPAGAIFMMISNHGDKDDHMISFKTDAAARSELHTMEVKDDIMKMRQVKFYKIPANGQHELKPMEDHVMIFNLSHDLIDGELLQGVATFEKAGDIPVTIDVKTRQKMMMHHH